MNKFIDKILGRNSKENSLNQKSLDEILGMEDETDVVISIGQLLWDKSRKDVDFETLNKFEKNILFIEMLEGEVNNGGFDQYFFNSSGEYAHETYKAMKEINAPVMADFFK